MPRPQPNKIYRKFISKNYCAFCGKCDGIDDDGDPRVDPCHVKTWASTYMDLGNIFPSCRSCHQTYENFPSDIKELFLPLGQKFLDEFNRLKDFIE